MNLEDHLNALVSELTPNLSVSELRAILVKQQESTALPKHAPVRGYKKPVQRQDKTYGENMSEASNNLANAINSLKRGIVIETPKSLEKWARASWNSVESVSYPNYKPEPEPVYIDRDPCFVCGARGDYDCGHGVAA